MTTDETGAVQAAEVSHGDRTESFAATAGTRFAICSTIARGRGFGDWGETSGTLMPRKTRNRVNAVAAAHPKRRLRERWESLFIADRLQHVVRNLNSRMEV